MINTNNTRTVSDLRFKTKEVLAKVNEGPVFLFHRSTPRGVILSFKEYIELTSKLEDYYLSLRADEYLSEKKNPADWYSLEEVENELKKKK